MPVTCRCGLLQREQFNAEPVFWVVREARLKAERIGAATEQTERRECSSTFCCLLESGSL